jgi:uncharacterized protein YjbJ (UPF0337 family)
MRKDDELRDDAARLATKAKGEVKEQFGDLTGNRSLEREGEIESATGVDVPDRKAPSRLVTGLYRTPEEAEQAYKGLRETHGYEADDIGVLMTDETRKKYHDADINWDGPAGDTDGEGSKALEGLGVGSATGGTIGAIMGAIAAIGTSVIFPGLGLIIAGPIAAAIAGAGVGGAAGGLVGALIGAGIPEERAVEYEQGLKEGGILLGTYARDDEHARQLERDYATYGANQIRR